jgi:tRNA(Ile)-lysidine synthase
MKTSTVPETVQRFIDREKIFDSQGKIVAAVSGGADSLCLLIVLKELGYPLIVAHFDHRLRADSGRDVEAVRSAAERLAVPFVLGQGDVRGHAGRKRLTLEEAARELRYDFLLHAAQAGGASTVAAGHTMDDQAETVLMHLVRGTGLRGLGGMRPVAPYPGTDRDPARGKIRLARPLLCRTHAQTAAYCRQTGWIPCEDPSNRDSTYTRNRIRRELIPLLEGYNGSITERLADLSTIARDQNDFLEGAAEKIWSAAGCELEPGLVRIPVEAMRSAPPAVQQALARHAILQVTQCVRDLAYRHVRRIMEFARTPTASRRMDLALGVEVSLENEWLVFCAPDRLAAVPEWEGWEIPVPGNQNIRHPDWNIVTTIVKAPGLPDPARDPWTARIDPDRIHPPLNLRRKKSSDRFFPAGMPGPVKLNDFLSAQHIPFRQRDRWPLVCDTEGIIWIPGYRLKQGIAPADTARKCMKIVVENFHK